MTPRQLECLVLVAAGYTSKEIALKLGISPKVVDEHVEKLCAYLGTSSRRIAVRRALERGLLTMTWSIAA